MYPVGSVTGLVLKRFEWAYGGRSVYLCGSFNGWSQWLMTPVEGRPTVFQTLCSLRPGYHEYKFIVDGEWKLDENQHIVDSDYGTVNTLRFSHEAGILPTMISAHASPMVRVSDGALLEAFPGAAEAALQISRRRISGFLSSHTAYELLPHSGKAIALDVELPIEQAFHILHEERIPTVPLWDLSRGQFVGVLSALDFILMMREFCRHGSNVTEEELGTHTISAWKVALYAEKQMIDHGTVATRQLVHAGPDESLKDVTLKLLQNRVATVPIINSSTEDGLFPDLLHVASLSGILRMICRYFKYSLDSLPILQLPICVIPFGTWVPKIGNPIWHPLAMLRPSTSLGAALNLLVQAQVSSIPIVDDDGSLLDIYSRSDITALAKEKIYTRIKLEEMTIHQALQLGEEPSSSSGFGNQRCHMCLRSDTLYAVMERLSKPGVRRLVIVEAGSRRVEGIISLSDVFRFLWLYNE